MNTIIAQIQKRGSSLGVVIPEKVVAQNGLKVGDTITFLLLKKTNIFKESFGQLRHLTKSTDQIMKEIDEESWGET